MRSEKREGCFGQMNSFASSRLCAFALNFKAMDWRLQSLMILRYKLRGIIATRPAQPTTEREAHESSQNQRPQDLGNHGSRDSDYRGWAVPHQARAMVRLRQRHQARVRASLSRRAVPDARGRPLPRVRGRSRGEPQRPVPRGAARHRSAVSGRDGRHGGVYAERPDRMWRFRTRATCPSG